MSAKRVSLLAAVLLCAGSVLAYGQGNGQVQNGQGQAQNGQGQGNQPPSSSQPSQPALPASHAGVVAIHDMTGTLVDIIGGSGLGHPYFEFAAGGTTYSIKAAPYKFLANLKIPDLVGSQIRMIFAECRQGSYLALQIIAGTDVYVFRDDSGKPVWRMRPVDPNPENGSGPPLVDAASIETVTAVVESIGTSLVSNRARVQIRIRDQQLAWVSLGSESLLLDQGYDLQVGDQVRIMLALQTTSRERVALRLENPVTGQMAMIRDMEGHRYRLMYE